MLMYMPWYCNDTYCERDREERERESGSGGSETRYQTEPPKTSHRLQQPPSYVPVRPSATTTTTFIKKLSTPTTKRLFSLFPVGHDVIFGKQAIVF